MATESFYQDLVIDTPEKAARLEAMFEEDAHFISPGTPKVPFNDPETRRRVIEKYGGKRDVSERL